MSVPAWGLRRAAVMTSIWGLGILSLLGFNLDPLMLVIPFLISARAMSHGIQLVERFYQELARRLAALLFEQHHRGDPFAPTHATSERPPRQFQTFRQLMLSGKLQGTDHADVASQNPLSRQFSEERLICTTQRSLKIARQAGRDVG